MERKSGTCCHCYPWNPDIAALTVSSGVLGGRKVFIRSRRDKVKQLHAPILKENNPICDIHKYTNQNN